MAEEKPLSERTEQTAAPEPTETLAGLEAEAAELTEETASGSEVPATDAIAAALSALSSAAAPVRERANEEESVVATIEEPLSENVVEVLSAEIDPVSASSQTPPPPPPPESADSFPAPTGTPIAVAAPTTAPVPPSQPTVASGAVPPAPAPKRKKWPWILAICFVAGILILGGIGSCAYTMMNATFHALQHNERYDDYGDLFNPDVQDGIWNFYYGGRDATFEDVLDAFNVEEGDMSASGSYGSGAYRVGGEDGIAPGLYYMEGTQEGVDFFYVFDGDGDETEPRYDLAVSVEYIGNYYAELEEGDAIIFIPADPADTFHLADGPMETMPPYESGCYRVGIDIPAGTYTITCQTEAARLTDSESGAFVMKDIEFNEDSITESAYVIKGGRQVITVKDGDYLELFAAIATPATASTKIPLQHAESELPHAA